MAPPCMAIQNVEVPKENDMASGRPGMQLLREGWHLWVLKYLYPQNHAGMMRPPMAAHGRITMTLHLSTFLGRLCWLVTEYEEAKSASCAPNGLQIMINSGVPRHSFGDATCDAPFRSTPEGHMAVGDTKCRYPKPRRI